MNRRSFLSTTVKKVQTPGDLPVKNKYANKAQPSFHKAGASAGLEPYAGAWGAKQVRHLLNRTMFGHTKEQFNTAMGMDMNTIVASLLSTQSPPQPPRYNYYNEGVDPDCTPGGTWVNAPASQIFNNIRIQSLKDWWLLQMLDQPISIQEKMTLFLQNCVPIQFYTVLAAHYAYEYNAMCRTHSLGNYKEFVKKMSTNKAMLIYLNGYKNQKNNPDENYGRELQELFTVGKGPDSNYTEEDVKQAAKVLTGYTIDLANDVYIFQPFNHDTSNKQFSAFYGNRVITGRSGPAGEDELTDLIDMLFDNNEAAKHIVRNIYRWFVYYVIDTEVEANIITPLADILRSNNYELAPVMETLLKSAHFFDEYNMGCVIKNPIDYTLGMVKNMQIPIPDSSDIARQYYGARALNIFNFVLAMDLGDPPNVAGWEAYRTNPIYHEAWINSVTISYRNQYFESMLSQFGYNYKGVALKIDYIKFTETVADAEDPNFLIANLADQFFNNPITAAQTTSLKSILLSGQVEDHYWTDAWLNYVNNPTNVVYKTIVDQRLYGFYRYFLSLAESQLI